MAHFTLFSGPQLHRFLKRVNEQIAGIKAPLVHTTMEGNEYQFELARRRDLMNARDDAKREYDARGLNFAD